MPINDERSDIEGHVRFVSSTSSISLPKLVKLSSRTTQSSSSLVWASTWRIRATLLNAVGYQVMHRRSTPDSSGENNCESARQVEVALAPTLSAG
jgi:hypothetical protein